MPTTSDTPLVISNRVLVYNAAFTTASATASWTARAYRRLEVFFRITGASASVDPVAVTLTGVAAATYYYKGYMLTGAAALAASDGAEQNAWSIPLSIYNGAPYQLRMDIDLGSMTSMTAQGVGYTGQGEYVTGINTDTADPTGITITLPNAATGWLEVIGYT